MDNLTAGNPKAHRIRLYYTETTTIEEGMPVCYEFDATTNWFGGSVSDEGVVTASTTTAEGSQNEGKYIRIEDPDADNICGFAGVVARGGWVGKSGPRVVDVYVPNGAIVPVRSDQNCTVGRTILAVHTGETHLTAPFESAGRAVAIAWETVDTATTTGLVLAKLDDTLFIYQKGDATSLLIDDEDTGDNAVNQINVSFSQASGRATAFQIRAFLAGGAPSSRDYGLAMDVSADCTGGTISAGFNGSGHWLNLGATEITNGTLVSALRAGIYEGGTCTFTSCSSLAPLSLAVQVTTDPGVGFSYIYMRNDGAQALDGVFHWEGAGSAAYTADTAGVNQSGAIKIRIGTVTHYLHTFDATDGATT